VELGITPPPRDKMPPYHKLAPHGTDGRLFTTDISACQLQSHVTQNLGQISQIWPDQI